MDRDERLRTAWDDLAAGRPADAEEVFSAVLLVWPDHVEALRGLGKALLAQGRAGEAESFLREALAGAPDDPATLLGLGDALRGRGRPDEAAVHYVRAAEVRPDCPSPFYGLGLAHHEAGRAIAACLAFREGLRLCPDNRTLRYLLAAITGDETPEAMPPEMVAALFDSYAECFDNHLTRTLDYKAPALLREELDRLGRDLSILDLGCGTGLCGLLFRDMAAHLAGVDLSPAMAAKARERRIYDEVRVECLLVTLAREPGRWDLVLAADVLLYLGDLAPFFRACGAALRPGGRLGFTTEAPPREETMFRLTTSGRFAHSPAYVQALAPAHGLRPESCRRIDLRREHRQTVPGDLHILRREG